jgi:hypothetical protein
VNIILNEISATSYFFIKFFKKFNIRFYFLSIKNNNKYLYKELIKNNILPISVEHLKKISHKTFYEYDAAYRIGIIDILKKKISERFVNFLIGKFKISKEHKNTLFYMLSDSVCPYMINKFQILKMWSEKNSQKNLFISFSFLDFFILRKSKSFSIIVLPLNIFNIINLLKKLSKEFLNKKIFIKQHINKHLKKNNFNNKVLFVLHKGLRYGHLYKKDMYYSSDPESPFSKKKIIHFDYLNATQVDLEIKHYTNANLNFTFNMFIKLILFFLISILKSRNKYDLIFSILSINLFKNFLKFYNFLQIFKHLKLALIDYDFLCPKYLLFALKARGIKTVSYQERPIASKYENWTIYLDLYFTISDYYEKQLTNKKNNMIKKTFSVGFYHFREVLEKKYILKNFNFSNNFKKKILILGYPTETEVLDSCKNPVINITAQQFFLRDIIFIAKSFKNVNFLLTFKTENWLKNSQFLKLFDEISKIRNLHLLTNLHSDFANQFLITKCDLIVSKPSTIIEQCLYVKKPFLIHEFTHNIKYQQSKFYNFGDNYFYCNTLNELDSKIKKYIFNKNYIQKKVEKLSKKIYGNMNINFNAKQKINFELTKMLN